MNGRGEPKNQSNAHNVKGMIGIKIKKRSSKLQKTLDSQKHSTFTVTNGINKVMNTYEQFIMDIPEEQVEILHQHDGKQGKIVFTYPIPSFRFEVLSEGDD